MLTLPVNNSTGAIAGVSTGTIENIYVDGKITGSSYTGGIVGCFTRVHYKIPSFPQKYNANTGGGLIGGTNWNGSGSPLLQKDTVTGKIILNNL